MKDLKKRITSRVTEAKEEVMNMVIGLKKGTLPNVKRGDRALYTFLGVMEALFMSAEVCYADSVLSGLLTTIQTYYKDLFNITMALAALLAVVALILWLVVPSERSAETGKRWFIRILVCVGILLALGAIFTLINNITSGNQLDITKIPGTN